METHLSHCLQRLNLETYITVLQQNGYTSWDSLARISEVELERFGFKLGHRRRLQREIASMKGYPLVDALPTGGITKIQRDTREDNMKASKQQGGHFRTTSDLTLHAFQRRRQKDLIIPSTESIHPIELQGQSKNTSQCRMHVKSVEN